MKVLHTQRVMNMRPALLGSKGVFTGVALRQRVQQRLGLLQVSGVKALGEPAVNRCQQRAGFGLLALLLPQATEAHGSAELPGFSLLAAGHVQGLIETAFRLSEQRRIALRYACWGHRRGPHRPCYDLSQQHLPLQPIQFGLVEACSVRESSIRIWTI